MIASPPHNAKAQAPDGILKPDEQVVDQCTSGGHVQDSPCIRPPHEALDKWRASSLRLAPCRRCGDYRVVTVENGRDGCALDRSQSSKSLKEGGPGTAQ